MHRVTRFLTAGLAALATLGLALMLPSAAGASATTGSGRDSAREAAPSGIGLTANITRGIQIYDYTGQDVKYTRTLSDHPGGQCGDDILDGGGPPIGSVLHPGGAMDFEVIWHYQATTWCNLYFDVLDGSGKAIAQFAMNVGVDGNGGTYADPAQNPGGTTTAGYQMNIQMGASSLDRHTIKLLDPPGTVINIPKTQAQQQATVLNGLCAQSTDAKCDVDMTREELIEPNENDLKSLKVLNPIVPNKTQDDVDVKVSCENSIDVSDSIGGTIEAGTKLFGIIEAKISVKYNHEITAGEKFTKELTYMIRPGYEGWVVAGATVYRDWGDFTISLGNTTLHLTDVYFDSPVPDGKQVWEPVTQKLGGGPITEAPVASQSAAAVALGAPPVPDQCNQV